MTHLAHLLLAVCVLRAPALVRASALPEIRDNEPDLVNENIKPLVSLPGQNEQSELPNDVKDVENTIRAEPADNIPVAVVVEDPQSPSKVNEVFDEEIKRPQVDLRNPGPPQHQEHETQNPEYFIDSLNNLISLGAKIEEARESLRQGIQNVANDIQKWITNSEQTNIINHNIQNLRETFTNQITKLNDTLQGFINPSQPIEQVEENPQISQDFRSIESRLQSLRDNFNNGLNTLSEGVHIVARLKSQGEILRQSSGEAPAVPSATATPDPPQNMLVNLAGIVQTTVTNGFNNVTHAFNTLMTDATNYLQGFTGTSNPLPNGALADAPASPSTQRPPWLNWNLGQLFNINPAQGAQTEQQTQGVQNQGPFAGFVTNIFGLRPGGATASPTTGKPAVAAPAGSNSVPEKPEPATAAAAVVAPETPAAEEQQADAPVTLPPTPVGPIRQILNNIPVVQRIQTSIQQASNPDKPRDTVKNVDNLETKGGFYGKPPRPGGGNNNDSSSGVSPSEEIKEEKKQEKEVDQAQPSNKEELPPVVSDKTE